jgi:ectoine hydroxylase-related dioxygenase (phytanoyl-CoA dioxygenase family)
VVADTDPFFAAPEVRRVQDAWYVSAAVRELAGLPQLLAPLEACYGRRPFAFQTLNFRLGSEQSPHTDALHFHSDPPGFLCGVWIALEDIRPEAGPLTYYPGSHRLPYPEAVLRARPGLSEDGFSAELQRRLAEAGIERKAITPAKGHAVVWTANVAHGGSPILDPASTRRSLVIHYFFEGTEYYTPLASRLEQSRKHLRLPTDIADGGFVWPRRRGRPSLMRPQPLVLWLLRSLRRRPQLL